MKKVKLKKRKNRLRFKRKLVLTSTLVLLFVLGIGYATLSVNLNILGNIIVKKHYGNTLYEVLEKEASIGTYAKEYTGEHQDSMAGVGSDKIYHWYAPSGSSGNNLANDILDKNNVIFANHCWQMLRTTDTGGVKIIYNGEPENNQCLDNRENHVGYVQSNAKSMSTTYYYGTSYTYDKTNNVFSLSGTVTTGSIQPGQYTCRSTISNGTCEILYYVDTLSSGTTYNVLALNGNSHYSQFGVIKYNSKSDSPSDVGYMHNKEYTYSRRLYGETVLDYSTISASFWYSDNFDFNVSNANMYTLINPVQFTLTDDYQSLIGKYTFISSTQNLADRYLYYITGVKNNSIYYFKLGDEPGSTHDLSYYNYTYTYGNSYTDNGNGTYTINNPTTVDRIQWYQNRGNILGHYVCENATNNTCNEIMYVTSHISSLDTMYYIKSSDNFIYANSFSWDGNKYILDPTNRVQLWDTSSSTNRASLSNNHYTCLNTTGECTTLSYLYIVMVGIPYYINLDNGKGIEDALDEMLYGDDVNQVNSTIKTGNDAWYKQNIINYTNMLEDTIFCNSRIPDDPKMNGWDPNGGNVNNYLYFKSGIGNDDISCVNNTDKFSLNNTKAQLEYPVGLLTYQESYLLNNFNIFKTNKSYWLLSPYMFDNSYAWARHIEDSRVNGNNLVSATIGLRPVVSLRPGTEYASGTGSKADPYVVNTFKDDDWATIVNNVRNGNTANYQVGDTKEVDMGSLGTHTLRIANKSTPSECNNSDFSETACGFVLEFADILSLHRMNPTSTNVGGWPATEMRTYVNTDIYNALPSDLKNGIINTRVVSGHGSSDSNNFTSTDKLYLQTIKELNGISVMDSAAGKTRQLDYYNNLGIRNNDIRVARKFNGNYRSFNLRGMTSERSIYYYAIDATGMWESNGAAVEKGVSPAFRIG